MTMKRRRWGFQKSYTPAAGSSSHTHLTCDSPETHRENGRSFSSPLAELLAPPLSPHRDLCRAVSRSHSDYCFLIFSSREWAEQQSDVSPSHVLFVCSHSSSANRARSLLYLFFTRSLSQLSNHPKFSSPLLASAKFFNFPSSSLQFSISPICPSPSVIFPSRLSIFISTLTSAILIKTLLAIAPICVPFLSLQTNTFMHCASSLNHFLLSFFHPNFLLLQWHDLAVFLAVFQMFLFRTIRGLLPSQPPNISVRHNSSLQHAHTHTVRFELLSWKEPSSKDILSGLTDNWGSEVTKSRESGLNHYQAMQPFWHLSISAVHHLSHPAALFHGRLLFTSHF